MKLLDDNTSSGPLDPSPEIIKELKEKHPRADPVISADALFQGPMEATEAYIFDAIDEQLIKKAALQTKGSAGPSGMSSDLFRSILCSSRLASASKDLRGEIATLTKNLATHAYDLSLIGPLVACRLIPLAKNTGARPIGGGETLRRISGKVISWVLKEDIKSAAGPLQTCASHGAGAKAAIHGMREIYEDDRTDAVFLIDANNAFNCLNRSAALHNIKILCPSLSQYIANMYRNPSRLFIHGIDGNNNFELLSEEGTTQGDPLAMGRYAIATRLIIDSTAVDGVSQVWLADDAAGGGK